MSDDPGLSNLARRIRAHVVEMTHRASSSHLGSCLSIADLLAVLYGEILRVDPEKPDWPERDRFIMSKGHAAAAVYAALAEAGFFSADQLASYYQDGTDFPGHVTHRMVPGVELSTGSLGHGLPVACGMALAGKRDGHGYRVYVLLSDGECDEGSTWEAALFAPHHRLDNLVALIDYNKIQSMGRVDEILGLEPLGKKWESFGWQVTEIDGHDLAQIRAALKSVPSRRELPSCIIAHTVKGKGVGFMENKVLWHYRSPSAKEVRQALAELGMDP